MYSPHYFRENDPQEVIAFMQSHPFATVCGCDASGSPVATHVPLLIEQHGGGIRLQGHFMRNTDHARAFQQNPQVLVLFTGAHDYVSASWYSNPQQASTWNYMAVHVKGRIEFTNHQDLLDILKRTTAYFENNPESAASFEQLPQDYVLKLSAAITGFEILVEEINNVFKLSQNRDKKSYEEIIRRLQDKGGDAAVIAAEMQKRSDQLFSTK